MLRLLPLFFLGWTLFSPVFSLKAQPQNLDSLFAEGMRWKKEKQWKNGASIFKELVERTSLRERPQLRSDALYNLGICQKYLRQYDAASLNLLQMQTELMQRIPLSDTSKQLLRCDKQLAYVFEKARHFKPALQLQMDLLRRQRLYETDTLQFARRFNAIGVLHTRMNDFEQASIYLEEAIYTLNQMPQPSPKWMSAFKVDLSDALDFKGDFPEAIAQLEEALELRRQMFGENSYPVISGQLKLTRLFPKANRLKAQFDELDEIWVNLSRQSEAYDLLSDYWVQRMENDLKFGGSAKAEVAWKKAEAAFQADPSLSRDYGATLVERGDRHQAASQYQSALKTHHKALLQLCPGFTDTSLLALPQLDSIVADGYVLEALRGKALAWTSLDAPQHAEKIFEAFDLALEQASRLRTNIGSDQSLQDFRANLDQLLEGLLSAIGALPEHLKTPSWYNLAFRAIEEGHFGKLTIRQYLSHSQSMRLPAKLENRQLFLNLREQALLANQVTGEEQKSWEAQYRAIALSQAAFADTLEKEYGILPPRSKATISNLDSLPLVHPVLSCFWGSEKLFLLLSHSSAHQLHEIPLKRIEKQLRQTNKALPALGKDIKFVEDFERFSQYLYQQLISPFNSILEDYSSSLASDAVPRILVVPDGPLSNLPFEALLTDANEKQAYWGKHWAIRYGYSAGLALKASPKRSTPKGLLALGVSDFEFASNDLGLAQLNGVISELEHMESQYKGTFWREAAASKKRLLDSIAQYAILHLATHAVSDLDTLTSSRIVLPGQDRSKSDLFAYELSGKRLFLEFVFLNTCISGRGPELKGEGVQSLGYAFRSAGTRSVMVSRWDLSDLAALQISNGFYHYLAEGMPKDLALFHARRDFIKKGNGLRTSPTIWANYALFGDASPIQVEHRTSSFPVFFACLGLAFLLTLLLVYLWLRKKKPPTGAEAI